MQPLQLPHRMFSFNSEYDFFFSGMFICPLIHGNFTKATFGIEMRPVEEYSLGYN